MRYAFKQNIFEAISSGSETELQAIIATGVNVNITDEFGSTPLIEAIKANLNIELIQLLVTAGADVNQAFRTTNSISARSACLYSGISPLMYASEAGNTDTIHFLLGAGADINSESCNGKTALIYAVRSGNVDAARALIAAGADVNAGYNGTFPLMEAVILDNLELSILLLESGANINTTTQDPKGVQFSTFRTALSSAKSVEIISLLVQYGADVNYVASVVTMRIVATPSAASMTPLMDIARSNSDPNLLKALLTAGASVNATNLEGRTALMLAAQYNSNPDVIATLLEYGADASVTDLKGKTALDYLNENPNLKDTDAYLQILNFSNDSDE